MQEPGRQVPAPGSLVDQRLGRNGGGCRSRLGGRDVFPLEADNGGGGEFHGAAVEVDAHAGALLLVAVHAERKAAGQDRVLAGKRVGSQKERGCEFRHHRHDSPMKGRRAAPASRLVRKAGGGAGERGDFREPPAGQCGSRGAETPATGQPSSAECGGAARREAGGSLDVPTTPRAVARCTLIGSRAGLNRRNKARLEESKCRNGLFRSPLACSQYSRR